jgi:hypothetical protein
MGWIACSRSSSAAPEQNATASFGVGLAVVRQMPDSMPDASS